MEEQHHLTIPISPPASPYPSQAFVFPQHPIRETMGQKNFSLDDVMRYIGIVGSLTGLVWAFAFQPDATTGGILFTVTGSAFLIGHITDKTCGAKARIIKAATARLESFRTTLQSADQTVGELRNLSLKWKSDTDLLERQKQAMAEEAQKLRETMESLKATLITQQHENARLQGISAALQQKITMGEAQIVTLNEQIGKITDQNKLFQAEFQKLANIIPTIKNTGKYLSQKVDQTTAQMERNLGACKKQKEQLDQINQFVAQMSAENAEMKGRIAELQNHTSVIHATTGELGQHLQTLTHAQAEETSLQKQMEQLGTKLEADKRALVATEQRIKSILRQKKPEEKKGDLS